jgi:hypothetical protein
LSTLDHLVDRVSSSTIMPNAEPTSSAGGRQAAGESSEARIAKALAHPLRARILQRLG